MKRFINLALIFAAVAMLVVATAHYKRLLAITKTNNTAMAAVLKRNATTKARIDELKSLSAQLANADGTNGSNDVSAMLAEKVEADKKRYSQIVVDADAIQKKLDELVKNDPAFAIKHYASLRAEVDKMNAPFCRVQHLSREQSEALADAEFQRKMRIDDMQAAQRLNKQGVDMEAMTKEANDAFASNVKAALGDDLYEQFLVYQRQSAVWDYVNAYGGNMALADTPLSAEQAAQLVDVIANACPAFQEGKYADMNTVDWDAVDAVAVDFLTPEQINFFKNAVHFPSGSSARQWQEYINTLKNLGLTQ